MTIRWIRGGVVLFFLLFILAVTWPGMTLGNRIFPLILGLPTSMVWIASCVVLSFLVLALLDVFEGRSRNSENSDPGDDVRPEEPMASKRSKGGA